MPILWDGSDALNKLETINLFGDECVMLMKAGRRAIVTLFLVSSLKTGVCILYEITSNSKSWLSFFQVK